jgi:hypothetical protein
MFPVMARVQNAYHTIVITSLALAVSGCGMSAFTPGEIDPAGFPSRAVTQTQGPIRISAAVPDEAETKALLGMNLYVQDIQPVWIRVENNSKRRYRAALWSIDPDYYSPMEVAWANRGGYNAEGKADLQRWFYDNGLPRIIPPGETRSGLVFTHVADGTKGFNIDVFSGGEDFSFTFFVPMPGFVPDYMTVDFENLYAESEIKDLDAAAIMRALENDYPCCSVDDTGAKLGDPLNVVLVGTGLAVRRAMLRGGWHETADNDESTEVARLHRFNGRRPDGTFHQSRPDGGERKELRLWLAPIRSGEDLVWLGQTSYDISSATAKNKYVDYRIDPDIDEARRYILQNLWYSQSLIQFGDAGGAGKLATIDTPRSNFLGSIYYTDGQRLVMWLSEGTTGFDEIEFFKLDEIDDQ